MLNRITSFVSFLYGFSSESRIKESSIIPKRFGLYYFDFANLLRLGIVLASAGFIFLHFFTNFVHGEEDYFDDKLSYNIYFKSGDDSMAVMERVEIVGFKELAGKVFLVVRSSMFTLQDTDGYILFDAITAILPDKNFNIQRHKTPQIR